MRRHFDLEVDFAAVLCGETAQLFQRQKPAEASEADGSDGFNHRRRNAAAGSFDEVYIQQERVFYQIIVLLNLTGPDPVQTESVAASWGKMQFDLISNLKSVLGSELLIQPEEVLQKLIQSAPVTRL